MKHSTMLKKKKQIFSYQDQILMLSPLNRKTEHYAEFQQKTTVVQIQKQQIIVTNSNKINNH